MCGVHGMVMLPDNWHGGAFTPGFDNGWGAGSIVFSPDYMYYCEDGGRFYGHSVRLVQDY